MSVPIKHSLSFMELHFPKIDNILSIFDFIYILNLVYKEVKNERTTLCRFRS